MNTKTTTMLQPVFRNLNWHLPSTVNIRVDAGQRLSETFHYHPQIELILLRNCVGNAIVGAQICPIHHDSIFLIGKNTPHGFQYRHECEKHHHKPHAIVIQFDENFMGRDFFSIPESHKIKRLLFNAQRGLAVSGVKRPEVVALMERMLDETGFKKVLLLLEILNLVQEHEINLNQLKETVVLSANQTCSEDARLEEIWRYTAQYFDRPIRIEEIATQINLTKESFCRYFKAKTGMTYMEYLFEYRIEKAKSLILENRLSVKEIGYACGFLSLSNFYYQFKKIMDCSPLEFQSRLFGQLRH